MPQRSIYQENKPLFNSLMMGILYFLLSMSVGISEGAKGLFMGSMIFLPGVSFPLTTCYYDDKGVLELGLKQILHVLVSVIIYHGCVWIYSGDRGMNFMAVLAGFLGSLLFMLSTKYILKKQISIFQILLVAILSGLAFINDELLSNEKITGLALFLWTVINGILMNYEFRKYSQLNETNE